MEEVWNPIISVSMGLVKGLGIGGTIVGVIAAIGFFLIVIGLIGYLLVTIADIVELSKEKIAEGVAGTVEAARERRER